MRASAASRRLHVIGNRGEISDSLFNSHRTDNAADDATVRPTELLAPVPRDERGGRILDS